MMKEQDIEKAAAAALLACLGEISFVLNKSHAQGSLVILNHADADLGVITRYINEYDISNPCLKIIDIGEETYYRHHDDRWYLFD